MCRNKIFNEDGFDEEFIVNDLTAWDNENIFYFRRNNFGSSRISKGETCGCN